MLPRRHRLHRSGDFRAVVRGGVRAGSGTLVLHAQVRPGNAQPSRLGLVVGRGVGGSVARHRTSRRLRHIAAERLADFPEGTMLVIRALPAAGAADSVRLRRDFDKAWARLGPRLAGTGRPWPAGGRGD